jgi:hypothetical protein
MWKEAVVVDLRCYPVIFLDGLRKYAKNLSRDTDLRTAI